MDKELKTLLESIIREKGGKPADYESLMGKISFHESKSNPTQKQYGGGPGRGLFQFEEGTHAGGITAAKRTKSYFEEKNLPTPKWLQEVTKGKSLDASTLSPSQQKMLFLGNMRKHPKADLGKVVNGIQDVRDFWAKYHWAGPNKDKKERLASWDNSQKEYIPTVESDRDITNQIRQMRQKDNSQVVSNYGKGGLMGYIKDKGLNTFSGGGTHEQNPLGGIPQGKGSNGKMNTVEEGEASYNIGDMKFIFSNRIKI